MPHPKIYTSYKHNENDWKFITKEVLFGRINLKYSYRYTNATTEFSFSLVRHVS